jgi:hypothetical protein
MKDCSFGAFMREQDLPGPWSVTDNLRMILFLVQMRVSAVLTNAPYLLNLDCDHYINNSKAIREAMCFMMDPTVGKKVCYVQFPQRFDGIDRNDRYANHNTVFFDVSKNLHHCSHSIVLY